MNNLNVLRAEYLTAIEISKYIAENSIGIVPIGCFEAHGPHLPLGTDSMITEGFAVKIAQHLGAIIFPTISYSFAETTHKLAGTLSINPDIIRNYVKNICSEIIRQGFKKVVLLSMHGGNDLFLPLVCNELFHEFNCPVVFFNPFTCLNSEENIEIFGTSDAHYKETCLLHASLSILEYNSKIHVSSSFDDIESKKPEYLTTIKKWATVGYEYKKLESHIPPRKDISVDKGLHYFKKVCGIAEEVMENIDLYLCNLDK